MVYPLFVIATLACQVNIFTYVCILQKHLILDVMDMSVITELDVYDMIVCVMDIRHVVMDLMKEIVVSYTLLTCVHI